MRRTTFDEKDRHEGSYLESYANPHPPQTESPREYFVGDIYERYDALVRGVWPGDDPRDGPYARKVKYLARNGWPQLRYLADFLDCSTVPIKQRSLTSEDRDERLGRVRIAVVDLVPGSDVTVTDVGSLEELTMFLDNPWDDIEGHIRLFVVEDLATSVIELLGHRFNIDPSFFRSHISDYTWFNISDPWVEVPVLPSRAISSAFFTLRHVRPYYFRSEESARRARRCAGGFNVLRRIDPDKGTGWADSPGGSVGTLRAKTSCYIRPREEAGQGWLGFLLVDPPLNEGYPLWSGYDNIRAPPAYINDTENPGPNLFRSPLDDFVYWTKTMSPQDRYLIKKDNDFIVSPILCSVPAQWLLSFEHITSRLSLIEWEVERRGQKTAQSLDDALQRLHPWRRTIVNSIHRIRESLDLVEERFGKTSKDNSKDWKRLIVNFREAEKRYKSLEEKADRIMTVLANVLTIEEAKKQMENARDITRITYLAFIFVPFSFVSSYFSMNQEFDQGPTRVYWLYFVVAVPLTLTCFLVSVFWAPLKKAVTPQKRVPPPVESDEPIRRLPRRPP